ncbi:unnamed protein product, partial [Eruca vesicaria subsp. sativa]|nr:unnamed protein product [Eruca vesicaria subsp. sativa]
MICFILFVFSILISTSTTGGEGETAACKPTEVFLINCGATSNTSDITGRTWTRDQKDDGLNSDNASFPSKASKLEWPVQQVPYKTVRIFPSKFTYSISVSPGWKFVRLHFYPTRYGSDLDAAKSLFSVTVNGFSLLKNFSPGLTANASSKPFVIKEFIVPVLGEHKTLNLTFKPSPHSLAFINGVEIVSMPNRLYTKGGFDDHITDVGSNGDFEIDDTTALETIYRVNVAGDEVPEVTDPGMFRQWPSDSEVIQKKKFVDTGMYSRIEAFVLERFNYTEKTPACVAPEAVYGTYRSIDNVKYPKQNPEFSLTWLFPVDAGFNYLVRLHFCDSTGKRAALPRFSISIGNKIANAETDVRNMSGDPMIPMYLDFKTFLPGKSGKRPNLRLDLHPQKKENIQYFQCGLSGIEILKLNNSNGNLGGSNIKSPIALHVLRIILIAIGSATGLATFIIVLMRQTKRKNKKDNNVVVFKVLLKQYTYAELKKITKSFSHTLGKGGFGTVYGGNLCNGVKVAVKVMKDLKGTGEDFMNEIRSMSQTSHVNIVSLLGFCYEGSKRAIVYEFLENGSLDQFISVASL